MLPEYDFSGSERGKYVGWYGRAFEVRVTDQTPAVDSPIANALDLLDSLVSSEESKVPEP
jgi:hypothetical protein